MYHWDKQELEVYDYISMQEGKRLSELETAKLDGIEQGVEQEKLEIVKNSILQGLDNSTIALITKMNIETIEKLRE